MRVVEYGSKGLPVVIMLHGGGLSWWNFLAEAELLEKNYHVVLPILDGHAGSDRPFTGIAAQAQELLAYIDAHYGGSVLAICGLSLGAQVLTAVLTQRSDVCACAVIESALVLPMRLTHRLLGISVSASYGLIEKPWFAKLQFQSLHMQNNLFDDYYRDSCNIRKDDMIAFLQANASCTVDEGICRTQAKALIVVGGKERAIMKKSARRLQELLPHSRLQELTGYTHGALSLNHPQQYVAMLEDLIAL